MTSRRRARRFPRSKKPAIQDVEIPRIQPQLSLLDHEACRRLHQASCDILQRTGVQIFCTEAVELLKQAGATVSDDRVRIPPELVEGALATVPSSFNL